MIYSILSGVIIFWITGKIMNLKGWGLILNTLFVIIGGMVGNWALGAFGLRSYGFVGDIVAGVVGCCIVLFAIKVLDK